MLTDIHVRKSARAGEPTENSGRGRTFRPATRYAMRSHSVSDSGAIAASTIADSSK
jgi:hypothetical protein